MIVLFETTMIRMAEKKNMRIFIPQFDSSFDEIISLVYLFYEEGAACNKLTCPPFYYSIFFFTILQRVCYNILFEVTKNKL